MKKYKIVQEIQDNPKAAIARLKRMDIRTRIKNLLVVLDNVADINKIKETLIIFRDELMSIKHANNWKDYNEFDINEAVIHFKSIKNGSI